MLAMADKSPRPGKWWGQEDSTTSGDQVTNSPFGGVSPISVQSQDEVSAPRRHVCPSVCETVCEPASKSAHVSSDRSLIWRQLLFLVTSALLFVIRRLGLGRAPEACLTWQQHIWFLINRPLLEKACSSSPRCPELRALGEGEEVWDAFQVFMVVATRGFVFAERHGALTKDGQLLVSHRLRKVPKCVRTQLVPMEEASLLCLLWSRLDTTTKVQDDHPMAVPPGEQVVLFQHGLLESSMNWVTSATLLTEPFLARCYHAVSSELVALRRLLERKPLHLNLGERLPSVEHLCASLPLALLLSDREFGDVVGEYKSLAQCLEIVPPLERLHTDEVPMDDGQPVFDIWLSNSRGNFFTSKVDCSRPYEPPLGHKPLCLQTFRCLGQIYKEGWTHFDMAGEDIEAVYRTIKRSVRPTRRLRPICVGFSQGASILLMNAHGRLIRAEESPFEDDDTVSVEPRGFILLCPPVVLQAQEVLPLRDGGLSMTLKHVLSWDRVVAILVNVGLKRMDLLGKVVEAVLSVVPAKSLRFADTFVRRTLRFHLGRVEGRGHIWSYKMTPNGLTSSKNIACFRRCIKGASDYQVGLDTIAAQSLPSLGNLCPVHIFLALDDNIASGINSLKAIREQWPQARRRLLDKGGRLKWRDPVGPGSANLVVSMIEGHSHLDMTWTSGRRQAVHQHIFATIQFLIKNDAQVR